MSSVFGNIFNAGDLPNAAIVCLKKWFPTYLREVERQFDLEPNSLKSPENYTIRNSFDATAGENLPKVVAISSGTIGDPYKSGKQYSAAWSLGIGVATAAASEEEVVHLANCYGAAVRAIILQHQSLDSELPIQEIIWLEDRYDDLPIPNQSNLYRAAGVYFAVFMDDVVSRWTGPTTPDEDPSTFGLATLVQVDLEKDELDG